VIIAGHRLRVVVASAAFRTELVNSNLNLLFNPRIKYFSERIFIASPFPVDDKS
jgi:hypothetical protein